MEEQVAGEDFQEFVKRKGITIGENSKLRVIAMWEAQHSKIWKKNGMDETEYDLELRDLVSVPWLCHTSLWD